MQMCTGVFGSSRCLVLSMQIPLSPSNTSSLPAALTLLTLTAVWRLRSARKLVTDCLAALKTSRRASAPTVSLRWATTSAASCFTCTGAYTQSSCARADTSAQVGHCLCRQLLHLHICTNQMTEIAGGSFPCSGPLHPRICTSVWDRAIHCRERWFKAFIRASGMLIHSAQQGRLACLPERAHSVGPCAL